MEPHLQTTIRTLLEAVATQREIPGGQVKLLQTGRPNYQASAVLAMRAAASLRR